MILDRSDLLANRSLRGRAWCDAHTERIDEWLAALFDAASPLASGAALAAIGGYGRGELCPASDIDVMLLHDKKVDVRALADRLWYPIWDGGLKLGHSVCTVRQALGLAADDLDTATALLSVRHVAGDRALTTELAQRGQQQWRDGARRWLDDLAVRVGERHRTAGEVAFQLEPDLKEGRGGMRDVHALQWAEAAHRVLFANDEDALERAYEELLAARVELQRSTGRAVNVLTHEDRPTVAAALGDPSPDALMRRLAEAGRTIAWTSDDAWRRVRSTLRGPGGRGAGGARVVADGVIERDGEIALARLDDRAVDELLVLRVAVASACRDLPVERATLTRLAENARDRVMTWTDEARQLFHTLLLAGRPMIGVVEALDHHRLWEQIVPEWRHVRALPQHNPYHRYTVDRHLLETVAGIASLAAPVERPDLLAMSALLHDLGKGHDRDHTDVGVELTGAVGARMNYPPEDVRVVRALVRHHLLLADVASRRDLDDPATIIAVADAVGSTHVLRLLAALTEIDGRATGPSAWGTWKAGLVQGLVERVEAYMSGVPVTAFQDDARADGEDDIVLTGGRPLITASGGVVTVVTTDRPGVFSRVAGVLALRGLDVVEASAYATREGYAGSRFRVVDRHRDDTPWDAVVMDLERALDGRLAIPARLAERARSHARHGRGPRSTHAAVTFDNSASRDSTVIDVEAPDGVGLLYRITRAFAELDLDIRSARVQTLGANVVDAFYVCDHGGNKLDDGDLLAEIERAVLHAIGEGVDLSGS